MYPADDGSVRIRLLINQCREIRQRLAERVAESRELRARAARFRARGQVAPQGEANPEWWGGGERSAELAALRRARENATARPARSRGGRP
jgi:hypothetical protein